MSDKKGIKDIDRNTYMNAYQTATCVLDLWANEFKRNRHDDLSIGRLQGFDEAIELLVMLATSDRPWVVHDVTVDTSIADVLRDLKEVISHYDNSQQ